MRHKILTNSLRHIAIILAVIGMMFVAQSVSAQKQANPSINGPIKTTGHGGATIVFAPTYISATDFTGDGQNDVVFFNANSATWVITEFTGETSSFAFGEASDQPVAADYDGDGIIDIASVHSQDGTLTWQIRQSSDGSEVQSVWGIEGDIPVVGDYDGDHKSDTAVWRPSDGIWYINGSTVGVITFACGSKSDVAVPGDYDGDGTTDAAVFSNTDRSFYFLSSADQTMHEQEWEGLLRNPFDSFVPADYDGDGKTDFAIFCSRGSVWTILESSSGDYRVEVFDITPILSLPGQPFPYHEGGYALPADYDNDGVADPAVWDPQASTLKTIGSAGGRLNVANDAKYPMNPVSGYFMTE